MLWTARRINRLRRAVEAAQADHNAACARQDTRTMHHTLRRLRDARHALLRAEVR